MSASRQDIKSRIASVESTKKITKAMQLVASSKLARCRQKMEANQEYAKALHELLDKVVSYADPKSVWLHPAQDKPAFVFVITSDMGLCGGYNANVFRMALSELDGNDHVVIVGSRGKAWQTSRQDFKQVVYLTDLNEDNAYYELAHEMELALDLYVRREISSIQILYTHYKNTLTFVPSLMTVLPVKEQSRPSGSAVIFEPSEEAMVDRVVPMAAKSLLYSLYLESKTSEQASRRMAMESATDNAQELKDSLELSYNRLRQGAITQEITEIVGGANALQ